MLSFKGDCLATERTKCSFCPVAAQTQMGILQNHYPDMLRRAIVVNTPSLFRSLWKMMQPFLDPVVANKITVVVRCQCQCQCQCQ